MCESVWEGGTQEEEDGVGCLEMFVGIQAGGGSPCSNCLMQVTAGSASGRHGALRTGPKHLILPACTYEYLRCSGFGSAQHFLFLARFLM